jgi:hypothetical protein
VGFQPPCGTFPEANLGGWGGQDLAPAPMELVLGQASHEAASLTALPLEGGSSFGIGLLILSDELLKLVVTPLLFVEGPLMPCLDQGSTRFVQRTLTILRMVQVVTSQVGIKLAPGSILLEVRVLGLIVELLGGRRFGEIMCERL